MMTVYICCIAVSLTIAGKHCKKERKMSCTQFDWLISWWHNVTAALMLLDLWWNIVLHIHTLLKPHLISLSVLICTHSTLRPGFNYQGQFGTFLFPLKCGTGNGKSKLMSKVPKRPWYYKKTLQLPSHSTIMVSSDIRYHTFFSVLYASILQGHPILHTNTPGRLV